MKNFVAFESCCFAPAPEVGAAEIEDITKFNQYVERHEKAKGVFAPLVVDDISTAMNAPFPAMHRRPP